MASRAIAEDFKVKPGKAIRLDRVATTWRGSSGIGEPPAGAATDKERSLLAKAQDKLYADGRFAILVIFQGMAGADIDAAIASVMRGVNPQGCQAVNFSNPASQDKKHHFLWRYSQAAPERGRIGIFNHSYYDEVIHLQVQADSSARQDQPRATDEGARIDRYFQDINNFESHLAASGIRVLKFFLHISREEQRRNFLERIYDPKQRWRFSLDHLAEHDHWDGYQAAYERAIQSTTTEEAPWYILPADQPTPANDLAAAILAKAILDLGVDYPAVPEEEKVELLAARQLLESEA